ncbi:MAG: TIGR01777 family oxidoreductase [Paludibacter sp.]
MKKVIIAGGTGFIGSYLKTRFFENGYDVFLVSRLPDHVRWEVDELSHALEGAELVVNLAGKSINCRHTPKNREAILQSRIDSTTKIGNAIQNCKNPPKLWINASATGIYQSSEIKPMTEYETELGNDFLAEVVTKWEKSFFDFQLSSMRQIALRTSVVLGKNGGALSQLVRLTRFGLGGKQASGKQMFSWIHLEDYFRILVFALQNKNLEGILNCTSPQPLSNTDFMRILREILHMPIGIPAPKLVIQFAAIIIGTEPELILNSSFVTPKRLTEAGFSFRFPSLNSALIDILN